HLRRVFTLFPYTTLFRSTAEAPGESPLALTVPAAVSEIGGTFSGGVDGVAAKTTLNIGSDSIVITSAMTGSINNVFRLVAAIKRSEEHTSELQSREKLVC